MDSRLHKKCPYSELFWSVLSGIWTEYGEILRISLDAVRMLKNTDQNNSEYGHFSRSATLNQADITNKSSVNPFKNTEKTAIALKFRSEY